jgi:hypothetical protein
MAIKTPAGSGITIHQVDLATGAREGQRID